ncbi:hypothetical protein [Desulfogranum japonicum]|uniref:hypothetical protein n=1 Tax=Desulfogranum japonicum TaxID=231447 RepID=UPI0003F4EF5A|nr:hypothetical protein [Desulfogranum japonicum]
MNNISDLFSSTGNLSRNNTPSATQSAAYLAEKEIKYRQSLDAGITLQTQEGDIVTLTANEYSQFDAYQYNRAGIIQNDNEVALYSVNQQQIQLASGQSFSFTVNGNLSENEIADIKDLLTDLDAVISEVKQGNLEDALGYALEVGEGNETIQSFTAAVKYEQVYQMESIEQYEALSSPQVDSETNDNTDVAQSNTTESLPGSKGNKYGHYDPLEKFFRKLTDQLAKHDNQILGFARNPINALLQQHIQENQSSESENSLENLLTESLARLNSMIDEAASVQAANESQDIDKTV